MLNLGLHQRAATIIQASVRGWLARCLKVRELNAIAMIQKCTRGWLVRRALAQERAMQHAIAEFQRTMLEYASRLAAARSIQAAWRGFLARRQYRPSIQRAVTVWRENKAAVVLQSRIRAHQAQHKHKQMQAAITVLSRYVPVFRARLALWTARAEMRRRQEAATVIQSFVRRLLATRRKKEMLSQIVQIQAVWRGRRVRKVAELKMVKARMKLAAAAEESRRQPQKQIGVRLREALGVLLARKEPEQIAQPMQRVEEFTAVSRDCCRVVASDPRILVELLRLLRRCNRSKPHEAATHTLLGVLGNVCRHQDLVERVFRAEGCLDALTEKLQMFRDTGVRVTGVRVTGVRDIGVRVTGVRVRDG